MRNDVTFNLGKQGEVRTQLSDIENLLQGEVTVFIPEVLDMWITKISLECLFYDEDLQKHPENFHSVNHLSIKKSFSSKKEEGFTFMS